MRAGQILYERACEGIVPGLTNGFADIVGRELVQRARKELPGVNLSLVEERSSVLIDGLEKHEIDIALAYEVHEHPGLLRVPLVGEETLFVRAPGARAGVSGAALAPRAVQRRSGVLTLLASVIRRFVERLGMLATPLEVLTEGALPEAMAVLRARADA